jgi:zinc protease
VARSAGWRISNNITQDDLYNHYHTYYAPNNATIVVVGDFDTKRLLPQIEKYFGRIPRGPVVPKVAAIEPKQLGERRIIVKKQAELPAVFAGYHTPDLKDKDSYALEVLQGILSSGKSSRLVQARCIRKQLALYAGGDYDNNANDPNLFYVYAGCPARRRRRSRKRSMPRSKSSRQRRLPTKSPEGKEPD